MPIDRPRRIFRRSPAIAASGALDHTLAVGIAGVLVATVVALLGLSTDLFGRVPPAPTALHAAAADVAVIDGDTLRLHETVVRLAGLQAAPRGKTCHGDGGATVDCGDAAAAVLSRLVRDRDVACSLHGADAMGRPYGRCEAGGQDLGREVVASGWARTAGGDPALTEAEAAARGAGRGLWAGGGTPP